MSCRRTEDEGAPGRRRVEVGLPYVRVEGAPEGPERGTCDDRTRTPRESSRGTSVDTGGKLLSGGPRGPSEGLCSSGETTNRVE